MSESDVPGPPLAPGSLGAWVLAARPKTLPAALGPVLVGGGLAWASDAFAAGPFLAALACAILLQVGTNLANDYSDFVRGADTPDRLGTLRATQGGLLAPSRVRAGAALAFLLSLAPGGYLVYVGGWPILVIGLSSIAAGVAYTGGPWPFGYRGLGDLFVFVFFGLVGVAGTFYVQALEWRADTLLAGAGVGALTTAILVVNNLRDIRTDSLAGKRTLAVVLGPRGSQLEYTLLVAVGAAVPPVGVLLAGWPAGTLLALAAAALLIAPGRAVWTHGDPRSLNPALAATARGTGAYGLLFAVGCAL